MIDKALEMNKSIFKHLLFSALFPTLFADCSKPPSSATQIEIVMESDTIIATNFTVYDLLSLERKNSVNATLDTLHNLFTISKDAPFFGVLQAGNTEQLLYIAPGFDLKVGNSSEAGFKLTGKGAEINQYFQQLKGIEDASFSREPYTYLLDPDGFQLRMDSLQQEVDRIETAHLSPEEVALINKIKEMKAVNYQLQYLIQQHGPGNPIPDTSLPDWTTLESNLDLYDLQYPEYGISLHFFLDVFFYNELRKPPFSTDELSIQQFYKKVDQRIRTTEMSKELQELLLAKNLSWAFLTTGYNPSTEAIYRSFTRGFPDTESAQTITQTYKAFFTLRSGAMAPDLSGLTPDGKELKLQELAGNIVYLDIWATWCGPCIREFPASRELAAKYEHEPVRFVYLSIDEDFAKWDNFLQKNPSFTGIHLLQKEKKILLERYQLLEIPRYILIDQQGRIVASRAPWPSSGKVEVLLDSLLQQ
jgi:thiol-disulfide isomerase/thioredoxin